MAFTHALATNNYGPAKLIVDASAANGTHTTIAAALTDASSGDTVFIRPGTYTENLTLKAGVNLTAYQCDASPTGASNVIIVGKATLTTAGTVNISGVQLTTNSDFVVAVTGSEASIVNLNNCYINATNNTAFSITSSSANAKIFITNCMGDLGTTGIALFAHSSAGNLGIKKSTFSNSGGSSTASTCSSGTLSVLNSYLANPITMTSTGLISIKYSEIDTSAVNATALTTNAPSNPVYFVSLLSGTATPLVISAGSVISNALMLYHSNATAVSGAGTLVYNSIFQGNTVGAISCTTITPKGTQGMIASTAPAAGIIGEEIAATRTNGSALNLMTATPTTLASIDLTPGIWDISIVCSFTGFTTGTQAVAAIGTTTNSLDGTLPGNSRVDFPVASAANSDYTLSIPAFRVSPSSTTTYYLIAQLTWTVGSGAGYGTIRAKRVA